VVLPFAPLLFAIVPPLPFPPTVVVVPSPTTVKLPLVFWSIMPVADPPLDDTAVNVMLSGVEPPVRLIFTAVALGAVIVPLVLVMVPLLSIATSPAMPASGAMLSAPKVTAPVFPVPLPPKTTPAAPEPLDVVFPKFSVPLDEITLMPLPVELVIVVVGDVRVPATPLRLMPVVPLLVDEILPKVAASVPVVRLRAWPVPFRVTSEMVNVPKLPPVISVVASPPVNPRNVFPVPTVIAAPFVMLTITPLALFVAGNGSLPAGGVRPVIEERLAVASCPINFWPLSRVTGPA